MAAPVAIMRKGNDFLSDGYHREVCVVQLHSSLHQHDISLLTIDGYLSHGTGCYVAFLECLRQNQTLSANVALHKCVYYRR